MMGFHIESGLELTPQLDKVPLFIVFVCFKGYVVRLAMAAVIFQMEQPLGGLGADASKPTRDENQRLFHVFP